MKKGERALQTDEVACVRSRLLHRECVYKKDISCVRETFLHQTAGSFGTRVPEFPL